MIKYQFLKQNQQTFHFVATLHQIGWKEVAQEG